MNAEIIEKLKAAVGEKYVLTEDEATKPFLVDWTKRFVGKAVVVRPANTEEVSRVVRIANETRTPVVPQAGGTTLVGGSIPDDSGNAILLSLSRLNKIEDIDTVNDTVTVEAGVILEDLHKAVEEKGYIERSYSKKDKRVVYINLTQKGIELLKKAKKERNSDIETIIRKLGKEKTEFLIEILEEISAIMDEESKVEKKHD